ncbi:unnamed protein product [Amoebophrya sp. A25]|nr:unnamed protein product [Amoebophrya sp. A25]|eukprot:GSA25T00026242001.1
MFSIHLNLLLHLLLNIEQKKDTMTMTKSRASSAGHSPGGGHQQVGGSSSSTAPAGGSKHDKNRGAAENPWQRGESFDDRALGRQLESQRPTAAAIGFGKSASRSARQKCGDILIKGGNTDFLGRTSPGVTYDLNTSLLDRWKGCTFGTSQRPRSASNIPSYGPTYNDLHGIVPKFDKYRNKREGQTVFGKETREAGAKNGANVSKGAGNAEFYARESPGAIYDPNDRLVKATYTRHYTMGAKTKMIVGARKPALPGSDPVSSLSTKPNPGLGKQVESCKATAPIRSFSKASRFKVPGAPNSGEVERPAAPRPQTSPAAAAFRARPGSVELHSSRLSSAANGKSGVLRAGYGGAEGDGPGVEGQTQTGGANLPTSLGAALAGAGEQTSDQPTITKPLTNTSGASSGATKKNATRIGGQLNKQTLTRHPSAPGPGGIVLTKIQRGLGKQIDLKSAPVYRISSVSRDQRNAAGNMITPQDRGPLAKFQHMHLKHNANVPNPYEARKWMPVS